MKIGILIPTRGDRPKFLRHAKWMLSRQTVQPDVIEIIDDHPKSKVADITWRYREGSKRAFMKGVDVLLYWEDDDWYREDYIECMTWLWQANGMPQAFGFNQTTYYHIGTKKYGHLHHHGRASMFNTLVTPAVLNMNWPPDSYKFTDIHLWKQLNGKAIEINEAVCMGIKHGVGLCGGIGHAENNAICTILDADSSYLKSIVDEKSFQLYDNITAPVKG